MTGTGPAKGAAQDEARGDRPQGENEAHAGGTRGGAEAQAEALRGEAEAHAGGPRGENEARAEAPPGGPALFSAIDATWPAAERRACGPFVLRDGRGGGNRVGAATATGPATRAEALRAAEAMRAAGQPPLFMIRGGLAQDAALDVLLAAEGYALRDPTRIWLAPVAALATRRPPPVTAFEVWPPLAVQAEIWAAGGIGPERRAVMERAPDPRTTILGRMDEAPGGTAFVACAGPVAMLHALQIVPALRRRGLAAHLMRAAAFWARDRGASHLAVLVTQANAAASALYASLGMEVVGQYHYRSEPENPRP